MKFYKFDVPFGVGQEIIWYTAVQCNIWSYSNYMITSSSISATYSVVVNWGVLSKSL